MRKILTVALLSSVLAAPAFAADLTANATDTTAPVAASASAGITAKPADAGKAVHKTGYKHAHKAKKVENKTM